MFSVRKKIKLFVGIFVLSMLLISCQNMYEPTRNNTATDEMNFNQLSNDISDNDQNLLDPNMQPDLEGGSETDVREPHPVSNSKLQQQYPDVLFLHGNTKENKVALSFDDGPDVRFTPQVLDVLAKHDIKATFFLIGARAKEHSDLVKRIHDEGHAIGNHTYWHPNLPKEKLDRLHWEVTETENAIASIVGFKPKLFRSPYGALNEEMVEMLDEMNNKIIGWNVDSLDWKQLTADEIADNALSNVKFGSIILMHDGGDWSMNLSTAQGLEKVITKLKEDNTTFVTIPELIGVPQEK